MHYCPNLTCRWNKRQTKKAFSSSKSLSNHTIHWTREHTFPGYPTESLQQHSASSYGSQRDPTVSTTMGTLSLCTDSARPPGTTTHQPFSNGLCTTAGSKSYGHKTHTSAQTPCHVMNTVTSNSTRNISPPRQAYMLLANWPTPSTTQQPRGSSLAGTFSLSCSAPSLHFSTPPIVKVLATWNDKWKGDNRSTHVPSPLDPNQSTEKPMNYGMLYTTLPLIKS
jgi:hypothetical protein